MATGNTALMEFHYTFIYVSVSVELHNAFIQPYQNR